jgi:hypothetical protein
MGSIERNLGEAAFPTNTLVLAHFVETIRLSPLILLPRL